MQKSVLGNETPRNSCWLHALSFGLSGPGTSREEISPSIVRSSVCCSLVQFETHHISLPPPKNLLSLSSYTVLLILEIVALLSPRTLSISPRTRPWIACARFLGRKFGLSGSHTDSLFERLRTARRSAQRSGAAGGGGAFAAVSNGEDCGGGVQMTK